MFFSGIDWMYIYIYRCFNRVSTMFKAFESSFHWSILGCVWMFWDWWDLQRIMKAPNVSTWNWCETQLSWLHSAVNSIFTESKGSWWPMLKWRGGKDRVWIQQMSYNLYMTSCHITHGKWFINRRMSHLIIYANIYPYMHVHQRLD